MSKESPRYPMAARRDLRQNVDGRWHPIGGFYQHFECRICLAAIEEAREVDEANPKDLVGVTKSRLDLVPPALAILAAPAMALGAKKYGPYNWREKPVKLSVYLGAIRRHESAYFDGEDVDPESGYTHLSHMAACLGIIADAAAIGKLIDDRPTPGGAAAMMEEQNESNRS